LTVSNALSLFRRDLAQSIEKDSSFLADLRGKNLACFCREDARCHADILLELANR
jgi:hypothetical protein